MALSIILFAWQPIKKMANGISEYYDSWLRKNNGQPLIDRLSGVDNTCGTVWEPLPRAWFNSYLLRGNGEKGFEWNRNWEFSETDCGAFSFSFDANGAGVAIDLGGQLSDVFGYIIVIDEGEQHRSYVMRKHVSSHQPVPSGSCMMLPSRRVEIPSQSAGHQLDQDCTNHLWVTYEYGHIRVGLGRKPGEGHVILEAQDPNPGPGIQLFGFGRWGCGPGVSKVFEILSFKRCGALKVCNPYNRSIGAPAYFQCWREELYYR
jgi:hypothetical protein